MLITLNTPIDDHNQIAILHDLEKDTLRNYPVHFPQKIEELITKQQTKIKPAELDSFASALNKTFFSAYYTNRVELTAKTDFKEALALNLEKFVAIENGKYEVAVKPLSPPWIIT